MVRIFHLFEWTNPGMETWPTWPTIHGGFVGIARKSISRHEGPVAHPSDGFPRTEPDEVIQSK
jgi:hypothetical protein